MHAAEPIACGAMVCRPYVLNPIDTRRKVDMPWAAWGGDNVRTWDSVLASPTGFALA